MNSSARSTSKTGHGPVLLFAEDFQPLRISLGRLLRRAGYQLLVAADGAEALELVDQCGDVIEGAVLDVNMPYASGCEVGARLRLRRPDAAFVLISGYCQEEQLSEYGFGAGDLLEKPFRARLLLDMLALRLAPTTCRLAAKDP